MPFLAVLRRISPRDWLWLCVVVTLTIGYFEIRHRAYEAGVTDTQAHAQQQAAAQTAQIGKAAAPANAAIDTQYNALNEAFSHYQVTYAKSMDRIPDGMLGDADFVRTVNQQHARGSEPVQ